jgi:lysophospholipase L1-like esterase
MKYMMFGILAFAAVSALGVTIRKDVDYSATVVLENFSGTNNPASAMIRATFSSITNGAATYNFAANTNAGYMVYNPTATSFDPALYKSVRIRMALNRDSAAATSVNVYPTPVVALAFVTKSVSSGTNLTETSFDFSALNPDGKGVRIDPFLYTNDGTVDQLQIDYIMADLGRTIGYEFNHDGDLNKAGLQNISSTNVANGVLSCIAATADAQVWLTGGGGVTATIDAGIYKYVEIRLKATAGQRFDLFWNTAAKGSLTPALVVDASADGGWHTYLLDFSAEAAWTGNLTSLRMDPVSTLAGATFEVDYVRFMETIPPSPPAPTDLSAVAGCRQVELNWTASVGALGYKVTMSNSVTHAVETHVVSSPPCTKIRLSNGTLYYFAVAATNAAGESSYTTSVSAAPFSGTSSTNLMQRESVVFCSDLQPRSAQLLFPPVEIQSVKRADGSKVFTQGVDYTVSTDGLILLTTNSAIPVLTYYTNVTDATYYRFVDTNGAAFYSPGGNYKHSAFDVVVTYTYTNGSLGELEAGAWETSLTAAMDKLRVGQPLNVTFFGDSITAGAQASSLAPAVEPFAPAYPSKVVAGLKARFGYDQINYANKAVGGKMTDWGLQQIQQVIDTAPDLVVLAFGMNDGSQNKDTELWYKPNTKGMIDALRMANSNVSIILVAEFSPNPEQENANYERRAQNRAALFDLYSTYGNMAFVDVGAVSRQLAARKKFQDFSGNNLNHPNDFLHAVYADLIMNVFPIDTDGDGLLDWHEFIAGTDAKNPDDKAFLISKSTVPVQVDGKAGRRYSLQRSDSLTPVSWGIVETVEPFVSNQTVVFTNGTSSSKGFYRVLVQLP